MNDDLISRDAVLDACSQSINILDAMSRIEDLPSVTPKQEPCEDATLKDIFCMGCEYKEQEPKTGHWITVTNGRGCHECSLCHEYAPSYQNGDECLTKYCPHCGAKLEEQG